MDKTTYETYEYMSANNSEAESGPFFVVQDDGTFLINRPVQYVTQVPDTKDVLEGVQPCTVYDITSQQFYVNVDNSNELISVSNQYILPERTSDMYTNSYLLQQVPSATESFKMEDVPDDQMEDVPVDHMEDVAVNEMEQTNMQISDSVDQLEQTNTQTDDPVTQDDGQVTPGDNFTEITLTDEQYQMWEQKGWILLETNETHQDALVESDVTARDENLVENNNFINENSVKDTLHQDILKETLTTTSAYVSPMEKKETNREQNLEVQVTQKCSDEATIRLKTNCIFKSFPDKIILGRTVNGKRLVARVVKSKGIEIKCPPTLTAKPEEVETKVVYRTKGMPEITTQPLDTNVQVDKVFQQSLQLMPWASWCDKGDVTMAGDIISQLLKLPVIKPSIMQRNLLITKVVKSVNGSGKIFEESRPCVVTGRVSECDGQLHFMQLPNMLHELLAPDINVTSDSDDGGDKIQSQNDKTLLHIHISETKYGDDVIRTSITLNKRNLPTNRECTYETKSCAQKTRSVKSVFACGACAAIYQSEDKLKEHQETHCLDTDDTLTIDTDNINQPKNLYNVIENCSEKTYVCTQCDFKFDKLSNCQRHMKTHTCATEDSQKANCEDTKTTKKMLGPRYKCKMCSCKYYHPATLSKHIVTKHIKVSS